MKRVLTFVMAALMVVAVSCTKDHPERHTVEAAVYCKEPVNDDLSSHMELYLIPQKDNLVDYYDGDGVLRPDDKMVKGYDWFKVTLETKDQTDDIFNQDYKLINGNKFNVESLRSGYGKVFWYTRNGAAASGGTVKIGTNSVTLLARFPYKGWVEVTFEGDIVKYDHIF